VVSTQATSDFADNTAKNNKAAKEAEDDVAFVE